MSSVVLAGLLVAVNPAEAGPDDCNGNGVPDQADIDNGDSQDCNANGVPDECDIDTTFQFQSGTVSPFGFGQSAMFILTDVPPAVGNVSFEVTASADLSSADFEFISVFVNGTLLGDVFIEFGSDCAQPPESETLVVVPADFNQPVMDFGGVAVIELIASLDVNAILCVPSSEASLFLAFDTGVGPFSQDCNGNGVPDECDLADGTSMDCNNTGVPDECEVEAQVSFDSGMLEPFDTSNPQSFTILAPPAAIGDVTMAFTAMSDLNSSNEFATVDINGTDFGTVFNFGAFSCNATSQEMLIITAGDFNAAMEGFSDAVIGITPTSSVTCTTSFVTVTVSFLGAGVEPDCNGNGVPDVCDIGDFSPDCNDNGIPDECELDCNGNGIPDDCDVAQAPGTDCNGNGVPDECDALDPLFDCNMNGIIDACGIADGTETDCNGNGAPDECDIGPINVDPETLLNDVVAIAPTLADLVPDRFNFSDGESGTSIPDGGGDMYDGGNVLNTNLDNAIPYTTSTLVMADTQFGPGSTYFTHKATGIFIMAAVDISIDTFFINGGNGADGGGTVDGFQFTSLINVTTFSVFVKRVYGTGDPSINHIIIVPGEMAGLTESFSSNTNDDLHQVDGLNDRSEIYYILVSRRTNVGLPLELEDAMAIVESFLPLAALGVSTDCNGNNTPDECDIADGTVEDCNGNGVPDACDTDCNGNNMPDECEIAAGLAEDCNANGRPDECDLNSGPFFADSGPLTPLGLGNPQTFFLMQPPQAADTVRLIFSARADLVSSSAFVTVDLNGIGIGNIFVSAASCPEQPNIASLSVDPAVYNDSFGAGSLEIMMTPSPAVDQFCEDTTFIQVTVEYESTGLDTDGDGIVDACESCPADLDLDLQVSINDMLLVLAQWGPCPPLCLGDIDSDGEVGISDLLLLLAQWGPCP